MENYNYINTGLSDVPTVQEARLEGQLQTPYSQCTNCSMSQYVYPAREQGCLFFKDRTRYDNEFNCLYFKNKNLINTNLIDLRFYEK